ncbi:MAG: DUF5615 family PIN-like protein [Bacteroidia bacterium]
MKLLLDANISWRLIVKLKLHFEDCFHADSIGLSVPAKDIEIWDYAHQNKCIIITNYDDFFDLVSLKGFPPKIVMLRMGNQTNNFIEQKLIQHKNEIEALSKSEDYGVIELY